MVRSLACTRRTSGGGGLIDGSGSRARGKREGRLQQSVVVLNCEPNREAKIREQPNRRDRGMVTAGQLGAAIPSREASGTKLLQEAREVHLQLDAHPFALVTARFIFSA